jgi:hypothetical protein
VGVIYCMSNLPNLCKYDIILFNAIHSIHILIRFYTVLLYSPYEYDTIHELAMLYFSYLYLSDSILFYHTNTIQHRTSYIFETQTHTILYISIYFILKGIRFYTVLC